MNLKEALAQFDMKNPDWSLFPEHFPDCSLKGFSSDEVAKFNAIKSMWELEKPETASGKTRTRQWSDPEGYRYLVPWSNAVLLRFLIRLLTESFPRSEYRRKSQMDDAARSVVRNIEEGYKRATTSEYLDFLGFSQGSLEEVKGDVRECTEDGLLRHQRGSELEDIGIVLGDVHNALKERKGGYRKVKGNGNQSKSSDEKSAGNQAEYGKVKRDEEARDSSFNFRHLTEIYTPLDDTNADDLTYEMLFELINKTDYLLRKLVVSLERKMDEDRKSYKLQQKRIEEKFKKRRRGH